MKKRIGQHLNLLKKEINNVEERCEKFGGYTFINSELDRNELTHE